MRPHFGEKGRYGGAGMKSPDTYQGHVQRIVIKAGAGTGKTHNLTSFYLGSLGCAPESWSEEERETFLLRGAGCRPEEIIAVTFTRKAAAELKNRFRQALLEENRHDEAERVESSLIGTVHGVCLRLLQEYAREAGISPVAEELSEEDGILLFRRAAAPLMEKYAFLNDLFYEFGLEAKNFSKKCKGTPRPMLDFCRELIALARVNGLENRIEDMGERSFQTALSQINTLCPVPVGDGEAELSSMRDTLEVLLPPQCDQNNYDWKGNLSKEDKAAGITRKLSGKEKAHWEFVNSLPAPEGMRWKDWLSLIDREYGKKEPTLRGYAEELTALGRRVFGLPRFRRDVERLIKGMFAFAAEAMERFQRAKQSAGVVDFADMERMAREALRNERVRARLRGRFRVLFVDEFQDTSPIQLSIFGLLGSLIEGSPEAPGRIIYVGDGKQSIYGFRGAAPELTRGCTPQPLWKEMHLWECWRSLPELCAFTNRFFNEVPEPLRQSLLDGEKPGEDGRPALNTQSVLDTRAGLTPLRRSLAGRIQPLRFWLTGVSSGRLKEEHIFASLARNIAALCGRVDGEGRILPEADKDRAAQVAGVKKLGDAFRAPSPGTRAALPGDIAVLCRSNKDCVAMADALEALGIPAAAEREGLLEQEDAALALNAFRLALDPGDKLAAAEAHLTLNGGDAWFEAARKKRGEKGSLWEDIPFMAKLEALHKRLAGLTPAELLDATLSAADSFRLAAAKPRHEERFADLEALRALAREYEKAMHSRRSFATAQGWLDWLKEKNPGRACGGEEAVQVWTYHKSKGLERKIVVLHGLSEKKANVDIFHPRAWSEGTLSTAKDPLDGRTMEWLPDVFRRAARLPDVAAFFEDRKESVKAAMDEEDLRLFYVGTTRACDMLILTASLTRTGSISSPWLNPFLHEEDEKTGSSASSALEDINSAEDGESALFRGSTFLVSKTMDITRPEFAPGRTEEIPLFPRASGPMPAEQSPGQSDAPPQFFLLPDFPGMKVDAGGIVGDAPRDQLGNMLHAWFAVWFAMSERQRKREQENGRMKKRLQRFCSLWNNAFTLWPDAEKHLEQLCEALQKALLGWFGSRKEPDEGDTLLIHTEWPLEYMIEKKQGYGGAHCTDAMRLDLLAEVLRADGRAGECLIIDHKCGNYDDMNDETLARHLAQAYGKRQEEYMLALRATGRDCRCWLHLPLEGKILEMKAGK